jgi:hypothetical protein
MRIGENPILREGDGMRSKFITYLLIANKLGAIVNSLVFLSILIGGEPFHRVSIVLLKIVLGVLLFTVIMFALNLTVIRKLKDELLSIQITQGGREIKD